MTTLADLRRAVAMWDRAADVGVDDMQGSRTRYSADAAGRRFDFCTERLAAAKAELEARTPAHCGHVGEHWRVADADIPPATVACPCGASAPLTRDGDQWYVGDHRPLNGEALSAVDA